MKKDWSNQKFGKLTLLTISDQKQRRKYFWNAICDCGKQCLVIPGNCAAGKTLSCGCLQKEIAAKTGKNNRQYDPIVSSARNIWRNVYSDGNIDFDTFYCISQKPCHYCGDLPYRIYNIGNSKTKAGKRSDMQKEKGNFIYNGLDRLDNTKPHNIDNVVPCCSKCNSAKMEMSFDEFIFHIEKIWKHIQENKN
jgi:hypothetical protein